ncbi:5-formyltetrahydrofolate cyclo-ligase [Aquibacillus kalidii]|uniref:5-formyltetrahydrofolate cyclo-ligase n=1 Tax=Aquibacillus kalidii TaxID=2762597 RepID=UPI001645DB4C|nr:5-formyltetrahydrofolate cyclo-ligase [Aquibacillus kalidii]
MVGKDDLRKQVLSKWQSIDPLRKCKIEETLSQHLYNSQLWKRSKTIGITVSQSHEWDTKQIIKGAWKNNKTVCVPKCIPSTHELDFYKIDSLDQLEVVYYNLLEPNPNLTAPVENNSIDLLIVPGIVFDRQGYRIGYGGGYFDRFLNDYKGETIALLSNFQLVERIPMEAFDIPVRSLITEEGIY